MLIGLSGKKQHGKDTVGKIIQYLFYNKIYSNNPIDIVTALQNKHADKRLLEQVSGWSIKHFADPLKDIVCVLLGCTREQLEDNEFKETPLGEEWRVWWVTTWNFENNIETFMYSTKEEFFIKHPNHLPNTHILTPRKLLQLIGTECGRQIIHPNIWVNALFSKYKQDTGFSYEVEPLGGLGMSGEQRMKVKSDPTPYNNGYPNWIITDVRFPNEAQAIKDRGGLVFRLLRPSVVSTDTHESETALDNHKRFDCFISNNDNIEDLISVVKMFLQKFKLL